MTAGPVTRAWRRLLRWLLWHTDPAYRADTDALAGLRSEAADLREKLAAAGAALDAAASEQKDLAERSTTAVIQKEFARAELEDTRTCHAALRVAHDGLTGRVRRAARVLDDAATAAVAAGGPVPDWVFDVRVALDHGAPRPAAVPPPPGPAGPGTHATAHLRCAEAAQNPARATPARPCPSCRAAAGTTTITGVAS